MSLVLSACGSDSQPVPPASPPGQASPSARVSPTPLESETEVSATPSTSTPVGCTDLTEAGLVVTVLERDNVFEPACLVVDPSQGLRIQNAGTAPHTFTVENPPNGPSPGDVRIDLETPPGQETNTEPLGGILNPGIYPLYCRFHETQGMVGTVVVSDA